MSTPQESDILRNKIIICTYPQKEQDDFFSVISSLSAKVLYMPMIEVSPIAFKLKNKVESYNWLVFTSKNAIPAFLKSQVISSTNKIATIGEGTAKELLQHGYHADFIGCGKSGDDFANELFNLIKPGENILLVLGTLAPNTLQNKLSANNSVERTDVYQTSIPKHIDTDCLQRIKNDQYDLLIVSSPSAINNLNIFIKKDVEKLRIISIGKTTTSAIRSLGIKPLATAEESSYKKLAEKTIEYLLQDHKTNKL